MTLADALTRHGYHVQSDPLNGGHEEIVWQTGLYNGLLALGTQLGNPSQ